jgi:peptidoglycan/LPS O-acetylase OafA/YrhL
LGDLSYDFYLFHLVAWAIVAGVVPNGSLLTTFASFFVVLVLISACVRLGFEQPILEGRPKYPSKPGSQPTQVLSQPALPVGPADA